MKKVLNIATLAKRNYSTALGLVIVGLFVLCAIAAPWIAPFPKEGKGAVNVSNIMIGPGLHHLMGTDELGRDMLSRVIFGARPALITAITVVGVAAIFGTILGLLAGFRGGLIDSLVMRISELFLSFPPLLLSLVAVSILGPGLLNALIALTISWWPWYARLIRGEAASLRQRPFVEISMAMGIPTWKIMTRHILRNVTSPLIVQVATDLGTVILAAGSLAFIGLGAQPPLADWGLMVAQGRSVIFNQWWISTFPGIAIFLAVLAFNLLGDALRDYFDPRNQKA